MARVQLRQPMAGIEEQAEESMEKPSFQVTIGRLEVVASPPVQPPAPKRRPAPTFSLQDYLDRRRVGR